MFLTDEEMLKKFDRLYAQMNDEMKRRTDATIQKFIREIHAIKPKEPFGETSGKILFVAINDMLWLEEPTIRQLKQQAEYDIQKSR